MKTKIYVLKDLETNIRYVGKTTKKLSARLTQHLREARDSSKGHKNRWLRTLLRKYIRPKIELIEEVEGNGDKEEIEYIQKYKQQGYRLTNGTIGGSGIHPMNMFNVTSDELKKMKELGCVIVDIPEDEKIRRLLEKEKIRKQARQDWCDRYNTIRRRKLHRFKEANIKRSKAATGRKHTERTKRKISEARKGKPLTPEHRINIGRSRLNIPRGNYKCKSNSNFTSEAHNVCVIL